MRRDVVPLPRELRAALREYARGIAAADLPLVTALAVDRYEAASSAISAETQAWLFKKHNVLLPPVPKLRDVARAVVRTSIREAEKGVRALPAVRPNLVTPFRSARAGGTP